MAGYIPFDPKKPLQPPAPAAPASPGGYVPFDPNNQTAPPPAKTAPSDSGGYIPFNPNAGQQTTAAAAGPGWGIDWSKPGGQVTMPQSVTDWATIANNEQLMAGLPGLRTQAAAARQRLDPITAASADVAGNILSPTTLLNFVPGVGPELAGGAHEGLKSYMSQPNWIPDAEGRKRIMEDAAIGTAWGGVGQGAAKLAPAVLPRLTEEGVKAGFGYGAHQLFGGWANAALPEGLGTILPFMTGYGLTQKLGGLAGEGVRKVADLPTTKQAIQNLILGAGSSLRTQGGPWDSWIPGQ